MGRGGRKGVGGRLVVVLEGLVVEAEHFNLFSTATMPVGTKATKQREVQNIK